MTGGMALLGCPAHQPGQLLAQQLLGEWCTPLQLDTLRLDATTLVICSASQDAMEEYVACNDEQPKSKQNTLLWVAAAPEGKPPRKTYF